jgi:hypothetical protein
MRFTDRSALRFRAFFSRSFVNLFCPSVLSLPSFPQIKGQIDESSNALDVRGKEKSIDWCEPAVCGPREASMSIK